MTVHPSAECWCPICRHTADAWEVGRGARWRLALVAAVVVALLGIGAERADAAGYSPARCAWLAPHLEAAGLPVGTFLRIAYRESRCARNGVCVFDHDDASCSRFGINMKTAGLRATWRRWCGASSAYHLRNLTVDLRCTKAAFDRLGLRPWRG